MNLAAVPSQSANLNQSPASSKFYTNLALCLLVAVLLLGSAMTLRRAKKQTQKAQVVKKSDIKKERKEKILIDEEGSFEVEEKYERVA